VSQRSRLRNQDGFIRGLVWIVVVLAVLSVVILDSMAIFNAYQTAGNASDDAAEAALTEYAQSTDKVAAKLAAEEQAVKAGLEIVKFTTSRSSDGTFTVTVTGKARADTYAFHYLSRIPQLKDWVKRTTNPVRTASAE
jgi:Tfp pilus assembly protein PilE